MKHLAKIVVILLVLGIGMAVVQGLGKPVLAAQIDSRSDLNPSGAVMPILAAILSDNQTNANQQSCQGSSCAPVSASLPQPAEVNIKPAQPVVAKAPQSLPEQKDVSTLPAYLNQFMLSWSPERSGGCSEVWNITSSQATQRWLTTPVNADGLKTATNYYILAGMLIRNNLVNASQCPSGGLIDHTGSNMAANTCGVEVAQQQVTAWQNQFDKRIYDVSQTTQIPATLIKNFIRQESQFWPGIFTSNGEGGLGQMTNAGADTLLRWSPDLYKDLCKVSFSDASCDKGYSHLSPAERATLQGSIMQVVNATCPTCTNGINSQQANFSVSVFSETLLANCRQVDQMVRDVARVKTANMVSTYTDLWKITLYNYNAGSGCTERAIMRAWKQNPGEALTWDRVQSNLDMDCLGGLKYVDGITK